MHELEREVKRRRDVEGEEKEETSSAEEDNSEERNRCNHTRGNNNEILEISSPTTPISLHILTYPHFSSDTHLSTPPQLLRF
jgi:hypothetical protein